MNDLPKLLRAIASGTQARALMHDIIFNAAADELERLRIALLAARVVVKAGGAKAILALIDEALEPTP